MACCPKCGAAGLKRRKGWLKCQHCGPISGPVKEIEHGSDTKTRSTVQP